MILKQFPKVLVLDDDEEITTSLVLMLQFEGYTAEGITDYTLLKPKLFTYSPDVLILDISLGKGDGRLICKDLKESNETKSLPIILFSTNRDETFKFQFYKADGFVAKPYELQEMLSMIEQLTKNPYNNLLSAKL